MKNRFTFQNIQARWNNYPFSLSRLSLAFLMGFIPLSGCKKFIDSGLPKDRLVSSAVFKDDQSATSAVVGTYSEMMQTYRLISSNISWYSGLSSDEMVYPAAAMPNWVQFLNNQVSVDNSDVNLCWQQGYQYIYYANACLEGLNNSTAVTLATKNQLMGESKFIRAFCYFYMVNLFGDVPLITTTEYSTNDKLPRSPKAGIYNQMIADLKDAQSLLSDTYPTADRVRPNKYTATALLARVYLYNQDWKNAETEASSIINSNLYSLSTLSNAFLKTSTETIWQLMPVDQLNNTLVAFRYVPASNTAVPSFPVTMDLYNSFESNDLRKSSWIGKSIASSVTYYYPYKYKIKSGITTFNEYLIAFRLAEQYLIRAEAKANQQVDLNGAIADVNKIRARAGLLDLPATTTYPQLIDAVAKERRSEFFSEWGHRWFDLVRTGKANTVLAAFKPTTWKSTATLWPIPLTQLNTNPNLAQNPGY